MNESAPEEKEETGRPSTPSLLKTLEDMLYNRITKKKAEMNKLRTERTQQTEYGQTEIETLQWVLAQSLSIRRRLVEGQEEEPQRYCY
jgi:hypothetical protein